MLSVCLVSDRSVLNCLLWYRITAPSGPSWKPNNSLTFSDLISWRGLWVMPDAVYFSLVCLCRTRCSHFLIWIPQSQATYSQDVYWNKSVTSLYGHMIKYHRDHNPLQHIILQTCKKYTIQRLCMSICLCQHIWSANHMWSWCLHFSLYALLVSGPVSFLILGCHT